MSSDTSFEQARACFLDGLACYQAGRFADAEQRFKASLVAVPGRISTLVNLAATQRQLHRHGEALATAQQVLACEPDNRDALFHSARSLLELSRYSEALQAFERLLHVDPQLAEAWSMQGDLLRDMGRLQEAAHAYRQALAQGADPELHAYFLSALDGGSATPPAPPRAYVEALFDGYAPQFEQHLVKVLRYRGHEALAAPLRELHPGRFSLALDLGCGTGLCGPLVKPHADRLVGVDLSSQMLAQAEARGVYDQLVHADIVEHLQARSDACDLVLAADVFIYVGDVAPVFAAAGRLMPAGGVFCFSAETAAEGVQDFELLPSLRYAHAEAHLRQLAAQHGFDVRKLSRETLREDQHQAVEGMFVHLVRS